ncbi:MAG: hypothetical protein WCG25_03360 [bacterium]
MEVARVIHAIRVPISTLNQSIWNIVHNIKHRPIENKNKYSCDSAILAIILGIIYLLRKYKLHHKSINLVTSHISNIHMFQSHFIETIHNKISITNKSCIISIHIDNLQNVLSFSHLSLNNFITTMVLLNDKPIPKYIEVVISNHNKYEIHSHIIEVIKTCKNHATIDVFQRSFISKGFNSIQTINKSRLTHILPKF